MTDTAPMPRFPPEIWSNIFIFSVTKDRSETLPALMSVNHLFRSIANRTPQLWTRLFFKTSDHFTNLPRAKKLLQKSGSLPLDVRISISLIRPPDLVLGPSTDDVIRLLREQVPRLRKLELFVYDHDMADNLLTVIGQNQPAPLLEELVVIEEEDRDQELEFFSLAHSFHPAPRLTHLQLPPFRLTADKMPPLASTVRNLTLDASQFAQSAEFDISGVVKLLSNMPSLQSFTFNAMDVLSFAPYSPQTLITMPNLHFLELVDLCGLEVLCHLKTPFLKEVTLDGLHDLEELDNWGTNMEPLTATIRHLSQYSPLITRIELKMLTSKADLSRLFSNDALPRLEVLRLDMANIMDDTLRLCRPGEKLQRLELSNCSTPSIAELLCFAEGCNENFELLIDSYRGVTQEDITALSKFVKVEFVNKKNSVESSSGYRC